MQKRTVKISTKTGKVQRAKIRSAIRALHVLPKAGEGWVVRKIGEDRFTERFATKQDAVEFANTIIRQHKTDLVIHGRDGRIETRHVRGLDPFPPKDRAQ